MNEKNQNPINCTDYMETVTSKNSCKHLFGQYPVERFAIVQTIQRVNELGDSSLAFQMGFPLPYFSKYRRWRVPARWTFLERITRWMDGLEFDPANNFKKLFGLALVVFGFFLSGQFRLFFFGNILPQLMPIFWVFLWASLLQTFGLKLMTGFKWYPLFASTILLQGLVYQIYGRLTIITDYPFSIGYSEAGRHYYASLFYAKSLYGMQLPYPFLHPSRYLLMSLPFLVDGLPLWFHRMWQSLLWLGLTSASAFLLIRRMRLKGWMVFLGSAWAFLYFLQGAVYYHLQVCVILVLAGVSVKHPWRSLLFVFLASIWAGISRVNWFPVPPCWD